MKKRFDVRIPGAEDEKNLAAAAVNVKEIAEKDFDAEAVASKVPVVLAFYAALGAVLSLLFLRLTPAVEVPVSTPAERRGQQIVYSLNTSVFEDVADGARLYQPTYIPLTFGHRSTSSSFVRRALPTIEKKSARKARASATTARKRTGSTRSAKRPSARAANPSTKWSTGSAGRA